MLVQVIDSARWESLQSSALLADETSKPETSEEASSLLELLPESMSKHFLHLRVPSCSELVLRKVRVP